MAEKQIWWDIYRTEEDRRSGKKPVSRIRASSQDEAFQIYNEQYGAAPINEERGLANYRTAQQHEVKMGDPKTQPLMIFLGGLMDRGMESAKDAYLRLQKAFADPDEKEQINAKIDDLLRREAGNRAAYEKLSERFPLEAITIESLPYMLMRGGPLASAVQGGIFEFFSQAGNLEQRGVRSVVGGASGLAGGVVGGKISGYLSPKLNSYQIDLARWGKKNGLQPMLGQIDDSFEEGVRFAGRHAKAAGILEKFTDKNRQAANRIAARSIGENLDDFDGRFAVDVFARAHNRIGMVFRELEAIPGRHIRLDKNLETVANKVIAEQKQLGSKGNQALIKNAEELLRLYSYKSRLTGAAYKKFHTSLSDSFYTASHAGDSLTGNGYSDLMKALDSSADRSLSDAGYSNVVKKLHTAREQWANLMTLEKGKIVEGGNVDISKLSTNLINKDKSKYKTGGGDDLYDLARWGENFKQKNWSAQNQGILDVTADWLGASPVAAVQTSSKAGAVPMFMAGRPGAPVVAQSAEGGVRGTMNSVVRMLMPNSILEREQ